ncbi:stage III sporulation protein AF [Brevibacillus borstelensis]|uniref:stage III sporulation protein AF n=1 Tax=Brevibacillus borstelensis TaxID=45462 RepID=UPI0030BDEE70
MTWLTLWLKKIILLVLLAAFLDLILPNTSMQRYVKMVMGLIILMTIISPVFALFQLSPDDLALKLDRYQEQMNRPADTEWKRIAERLAGKQEKQIDAYVQSQVEASVKARLREDYGVEATAVKVVLDNKSKDEAKLQRIEVAIASEENSRTASEAVKPIEPVEPVRIEINSQGNEQAERELPAATQQSDPLSRSIARDLAAQWGLREEQIIVKRDQAGYEKR